MCIATNYTKPESHKDFVCLYLKSFIDEDVQFYRLIKKIGKFINTQEVRDIDELIYVNNDRFKRDLILPYTNNIAKHQYQRNSILKGILQTLKINETYV